MGSFLGCLRDIDKHEVVIKPLLSSVLHQKTSTENLRGGLSDVVHGSRGESLHSVHIIESRIQLLFLRRPCRISSPSTPVSTATFQKLAAAVDRSATDRRRWRLPTVSSSGRRSFWLTGSSAPTCRKCRASWISCVRTPPFISALLLVFWYFILFVIVGDSMMHVLCSKDLCCRLVINWFELVRWINYNLTLELISLEVIIDLDSYFNVINVFYLSASDACADVI